MAISPEAFEQYFEVLRKSCLPGIWSKGIALARELAIIEDSQSDEEIKLRVVLPNRPVSPKVTLWPSEEDWHCNCGEKTDLCVHIVAAAVAVKNGTTKSASTSADGSSKPSAGAAALLSYRFMRAGGRLRFERWIVHPSGSEEPLTQSLVSHVGGISSGRIAAAAIAATREDFLADAALNEQKSGELPPPLLIRLLGALAHCSNITLDGQSVSTSSRPIGAKLVVADEGSGFLLRLVEEQKVDESFANGAVRIGSTLHPRAADALSAEERARLSGTGLRVPLEELGELVSSILPALENRIGVRVDSPRVPVPIRMAPRLVLETSPHPGQRLAVAPVIVYGDPPVARVERGRLKALSIEQVPLRDLAAEKSLARKLQTELHLQLEQATTFTGEEAVRFVETARDWTLTGPGKRNFVPDEMLSPSLEVSNQGFQLRFTTSSGSATPEAVLRAWNSGAPHVALLDGGWARLPSDWLRRHAETLFSLLTARQPGGALPKNRLPELADFCAELDHPPPPALARLRAQIEDFTRLPEAALPSDLRAELRSYQKLGVSWLQFAQNNDMGALLADDMGLGKTLQVIATLKPGERTLVVAPTSVLASWREQLQRFRPSLPFVIHHGAGRASEASAPGAFPWPAPLVITSYALLRLDQSLFTSVEWGTIVLDEAQTIRNPESQVSRVAHQLRTAGRIALTGTPVENRLEDLWSQFEFLNPGLLGTLSEFKERYAAPIAGGDASATARLQRKLRPFLLRRLKREVATELPPRIETVLECELSQTERDLYSSVLGASREEAIRQLELEGNALGVLEVLLRLRQACCHTALLPGQSAATSSKTELLLETLETSIQEGHRSLVFSQWTGFLDLIEPHLNARGIRFLRLDGATRDRAGVVSSFQDPAGPPVLLISLKAGGTGLTLTEADHVFLLDPWWNPAVENQAADRAHRIGQTRTVMIHRLIAKDTIEEKVLSLQRAKSELAVAMVEGSAMSSAPTREDILELLRD